MFVKQHLWPKKTSLSRPTKRSGVPKVSRLTNIVSIKSIRTSNKKIRRFQGIWTSPNCLDNNDLDVQQKDQDVPKVSELPKIVLINTIRTFQKYQDFPKVSRLSKIVSRKTIQTFLGRLDTFGTPDRFVGRPDRFYQDNFGKSGYFRNVQIFLLDIQIVVIKTILGSPYTLEPPDIFVGFWDCFY